MKNHEKYAEGQTTCTAQFRMPPVSFNTMEKQEVRGQSWGKTPKFGNQPGLDATERWDTPRSSHRSLIRLGGLRPLKRVF